MSDSSEDLMPRRLYRDPDRGMIWGVCAGVADYFGFDRSMVRLGTVIAMIVFAPAPLLIYIGLRFLLPRRNPAAANERSARDEAFTRAVRSSPHSTLSKAHYRFRDLESRLARMERYVTSPRYRLDEEFRNLEERRDD